MNQDPETPEQVPEQPDQSEHRPDRPAAVSPDEQVTEIRQAVRSQPVVPSPAASASSTPPFLPAYQPQQPAPPIPPRVQPGYPQYPQPYGYAPPPPPPPPYASQPAPAMRAFQQKSSGLWAGLSQGKRIALIVAASILGLCLVCSMCGLIGNALGSSAAPSGPSSSDHRPTLTPKATATPTTPATPNPNAGYQDYRAMVTSNSTTIAADATLAGESCSAGDVSGCRATLVFFDTDVKKFQADLDAHPAPACLKTADGYLRSALSLYHQAAQDVIRGIDTNNVTLVNKGTALMNSGTAAMDKSTAATKAAHCA